MRSILRYEGIRNKYFSNIKGDLFGAFSAAIIALPMTLGYGMIAFAPLGAQNASFIALSGLYGLIFSGFFAALFGGTSIQMSGPKPSLALVMATVIAGLLANSPSADSSPFHGNMILAMTFLCVLLAGIFQLFLGAFRFGNLVKYIPFPVISGFMNGIAILLILGQLRIVLGLEGKTPLLAILANPAMINPLTLLVGASTIAAVFGFRRLGKIIPPPVAGILIGVVMHYVLRSLMVGHAPGPVIGNIPAELPKPDMLWEFIRLLGSSELPGIISKIFLPALILGALGSMESLLGSLVADNLTETRHDSNRELVGQGIGNIITSLFGGLAGAGSAAGTVTSFNAGGRTPLAAMLCSLFILLVVTVFGPWIGMIPKAAIAGLVMAVAFSMFDLWTLRLAGKTLKAGARRREVGIDLFVILLVTLVTVCINLVTAVILGVMAASALFISKVGKSVVRRKFTGNQVRSKKMRCSEYNGLLENERERIVVIELQGSIFFGSAESLATEVDASMTQADYCILDMRHVHDLDGTGAKVIVQINRTLVRSGKHLLISFVRENDWLWRILQDMDVISTIGEGNFFNDTDAALEWAENQLLEGLCGVSGKSDALTLDKTDLVSGFTVEELSTLGQIVTSHCFKKEEPIFRAGDPGRDLFILKKGAASVKIELAEPGATKRLVTFGPGTMFGEVALIDGNPRSAGVWADEDCEVYKLSFSNFELLRKENPEIATKLLLNMARELSRRLRLSSDEVRALAE